MKYLDALFVALHRRLPRDFPRTAGILALAVGCNAATLLWLLQLHYLVPPGAPRKLLFLLVLTGSTAFVLFRYRASQRASFTQQAQLPTLQPAHAVAYLVLSMLLFLVVARLLRAGF